MVDEKRWEHFYNITENYFHRVTTLFSYCTPQSFGPFTGWNDNVIPSLPYRSHQTFGTVHFLSWKRNEVKDLEDVFIYRYRVVHIITLYCTYNCHFYIRFILKILRQRKN